MNTWKTQRILRRSMIFLFFVMCLVLLWVQAQADQTAILNGTKYQSTQYYRAVFFYLVQGVLLAVLEHHRVRDMKSHTVFWREGKVRAQFLLVFDILLGAAILYWCWLRFRKIPDGDTIWNPSVHASTNAVFGPCFVVLFLIWYLYGCWPALKLEWNCDRPILVKLCMSVKAMLFDAIAKSRTMAGKFLRAVVFLWAFGSVTNTVIKTLQNMAYDALAVWPFLQLTEMPLQHWIPFSVAGIAWLLLMEEDGLKEVL